MFQRLNSASIVVSDQDKAKAFYVDTLGFVLRRDEPMYPGAPNRWLTVAPSADAETDILLDLPTEQVNHFRPMLGQAQLVTIAVTDLVKLYNDLKAKGVRFQGEPDVQPWGTSIFMLDPDDNQILLIQLPTG